jgi:hypothetical protein
LRRAKDEELNVEIRHTTPLERDPARLREALPWYANGTLGADDRAWVEQALAADDDPALRDDLSSDRRLAEALEQKLAEVPADIGWATLLQKVRTDAAREATAAPAQGGGASESWMQRIARLLSAGLSPRLGMAMAVLVAVQAVALGILVGERQAGGPDTVEYRSGPGAGPVTAIRALFHESITEKTLREALAANGATIVDGPNPLGEYWIVTGAGDPEAVARALRDAGVIANYVIDQRQAGR